MKEKLKKIFEKFLLYGILIPSVGCGLITIVYFIVMSCVQYEQAMKSANYEINVDGKTYYVQSYELKDKTIEFVDVTTHKHHVCSAERFNIKTK